MLPWLKARFEFKPTGTVADPWPSGPHFSPKAQRPGATWQGSGAQGGGGSWRTCEGVREEEDTRGLSRRGCRGDGAPSRPGPSVPAAPATWRGAPHRGGGARRRRLAQAVVSPQGQVGSPDGSATLPGSARPAEAAESARSQKPGS